MALGSFMIETLDQSPNYWLSLTGRALPYRPMTWEGTQQLEVVWYPGFPNATAQALGPHESTSTFKGYWKDRFLGVVDAGETPVQKNGQNVFTAADTVDHIDALRRIGSQLKVEWYSAESSGAQTIQRIGYLTRFSQTWHTAHDCEWEMEFTWTGLDEAPIRSVVPKERNYATTANVLAQQTNAVSQVLSAVTKALNQASSGVAGFNQKVGDFLGDQIGQVANGVAALTSLSANIANSVQIPADATSQALGIYSGLSRSYTNLATSMEQSSSTCIEGAKSLANSPGNYTGQTEQTKEFFAQLKFWETTRTYRSLAQTSEGFVQETVAAEQPQPDFIYVASQGDDLRRVATEFYGDPSAWVFLAEYNGLVSSLLVAGQQVKVPPTQTPRAA